MPFSGAYIGFLPLTANSGTETTTTHPHATKKKVEERKVEPEVYEPWPRLRGYWILAGIGDPVAHTPASVDCIQGSTADRATIIYTELDPIIVQRVPRYIILNGVSPLSTLKGSDSATILMD